MSYYFSRCATARYEEKYVEFLLEHYHELNLPYPFPIALSFLASPVLLEKGEIFLCFNEEYEVIGALGYIYGTGEQAYTDTYVAQIQCVFFLEEYRRTRMFLEGLQFLTQYIAQLNRDVQEIRFWTPTDDYLHRLLNKIAERIASVESDFGLLDEYRTPFPAWKAYSAKFRQHIYF